MSEEWKPVTGFKYYQVSSLGRVRSLDRIIVGCDSRVRYWNGKVLKPGLYKDHYQVVVLNVCGKKITKNVHELVALAFLPPKPSPRHWVNHIDGNKQNPVATNLEWNTPAANADHSIETGLRKIFSNRWKKKVKNQYARAL